MNPAAILALISDLYSQITVLNEENTRLREQLAKQNSDSTVEKVSSDRN